jgi:hypothetical protein
MAEVFSDDFNFEIGDLLSHPVYPATRQPCARLFMLMRPIQAHCGMFARAPVHACAPASRAHPLLQAICSHALSRVFQEPKTLPEYKRIEPSDPLSPSPGKKHILSYEAPPSRSRPLPCFASMCTPAHRITEPFSPLDIRISHLHKTPHLTPPPFPAHLSLKPTRPNSPQGHLARPAHWDSITLTANAAKQTKLHDER